MDNFLNVNKTTEHLCNPITYKELNSDPTRPINNDILTTKDHETRHHLIPPKPICNPFFYDLPKVHELNIQLQPKALACDSQTSHTQTMSPTS